LVQILDFSDFYGDDSTLRLLGDTLKDGNYDYMLVAGDFTN